MCPTIPAPTWISINRCQAASQVNWRVVKVCKPPDISTVRSEECWWRKSPQWEEKDEGERKTNSEEKVSLQWEPGVVWCPPVPQRLEAEEHQPAEVRLDLGRFLHLQSHPVRWGPARLGGRREETVGPTCSRLCGLQWLAGRQRELQLRRGGGGRQHGHRGCV